MRWLVLAMTITAVSPGTQEGGNHANSATLVTSAYGANVTAGNLLVIEGMKESSSSDPFVAGDCTQSAGTAVLGPITLDRTPSQNQDIGGGDFHNSAIWSAIVQSSGSCTMQVGGAPAGSFLLIGRGEYNATNGWDANRVETSAGNGTATDNTNGSSGNATSAGGALFVGAIAISALNITVTPDAAFTQIFEDETGTTDEVGSAIRQIVSSGTTDSADWTIGTNGGWAATLVVYKEAAAAAAAQSLALTGVGA